MLFTHCACIGLAVADVVYDAVERVQLGRTREMGVPLSRVFRFRVHGLSHDFYQVMVGKQDMNLYGWKQLIEWSLEHVCMTEKEYRDVRKKWEELWSTFIHWVVETYENEERIP